MVLIMSDILSIAHLRRADDHTRLGTKVIGSTKEQPAFKTSQGWLIALLFEGSIAARVSSVLHWKFGTITP